MDVYGPGAEWASSTKASCLKTAGRAACSSPAPAPFTPAPQGYGLTESCAATCIAEPFKWSANGTVGPPLPGVRVRGPRGLGARPRC
jgi:hypothetical protein